VDLDAVLARHPSVLYCLDWAEGQHRLSEHCEGRFGMDDQECREALTGAGGAEERKLACRSGLVPEGP
jgi:hypothetical protein